MMTAREGEQSKELQHTMIQLTYNLRNGLLAEFRECLILRLDDDFADVHARLELQISQENLTVNRLRGEE